MQILSPPLVPFAVEQIQTYRVVVVSQHSHFNVPPSILNAMVLVAIKSIAYHARITDT